MEFETQKWDITRIQNNLNLGIINLNPPYQRESGIWTTDQKQNFIDSLVMNIPIPPLYLHRKGTRENPKYDVVDGKQRINAIASYLKDEYTLTDDCDIAAYRNNKYSSLAEERGIFPSLSLDVTLIWDCDEEHIADMFERHNSGSKLNAAERRRALEHKTTLVKIIDELKANTIFTKGRRQHIIDYSSKRYADEDALAKIYHLLRNSNLEQQKLFTLDIKSSSIRKTYLDNSKTIMSDKEIKDIQKGIKLIFNCFKDSSPRLTKGPFISHMLVFLFLEKNYTFNDKTTTSNIYNKLYQLISERRKYEKALLNQNEAESSQILTKFQNRSDITKNTPLVTYISSLRADTPALLASRFQFLLHWYLEHLPLKPKDNQRNFTLDQKTILLINSDYKCENCNKTVTVDTCQADHKEEHNKGGLTIIENGQILCINCHTNKTTNYNKSNN